MIEYWAALSIGLLGSLHCVGMCGPIAFALPLNRSTSFSIFSGNGVYQLGRLVTYFLIGIVFGLFGRGLYLAGLQQFLSISIGIIMIGSVFLTTSKLNLHFSSFNLWLGSLKGEMGKRFGTRSHFNLFIIGILNGLLPCGLVYMAVIGSIGMATPIEGGVFMLAFGIGTLPLMLFIGVYGGKLQQRFMLPFKKAIPVVLLLIGVLFVVRGLDLGIPYVSPALSEGNQFIKCY